VSSKKQKTGCKCYGLNKVLYLLNQKTIKNSFIMDAAEKVLNALKKSKEPLNAGKIVEITKLDRKEVDKAMKQLKDSGQIVSPVRCFWTAK
jgi:hypothetical protein